MFLMCIATLHRLNCSGQNSKTQFAVYDSGIPVTLKEDQGNQTWHELLDHEQGYFLRKVWKTSLKQYPPKSQR